MNTIHYVLGAAVVASLLVYLLKRDILKNKVSKPKKSEDSILDKVEDYRKDEVPDLNDVFLKHSGGRIVINLVKVFNPSDLMILRSILSAEGVDNYVKSNHFGDLYGSAKESIFSTTVISIFEDKIDEGRDIVEQYIRNKQKDQTDPDPSLADQAQLAATVLTGMPTAASDLKYLPELLL